MGCRPPILFALLLAACAGRTLRADEQVLHVREPVGAGAGGVAVAELEASDADAPSLVLLRALPGGRWERLAEAPAADAARAAEELREGAPLRLPPSFEESLAAAGLADPLPPAASLPAALQGPLAGWTFDLREVDDERYGPLWLAWLRSAAGAGEVARFVRKPDAVRLAAPAIAVVATGSGDGELRTSDVAVLDLAVAAGRILAAATEGRDPADALALLDRAAALAPGDPVVAFRRAEVLAVASRPLDEILEALSRAIEADPVLYRMRARTSPAFAPIREERAFRELTAPQPLPGT